MTKRARMGLPLRVQRRTFWPVFLEAWRRCDPFSDREILIRRSRENDAMRLLESGKRIMVNIRWITPQSVSSSQGIPLYFLVASSSSTGTPTPLSPSDSYDDPCSILFQSQCPVAGSIRPIVITSLEFETVLSCDLATEETGFDTRGGRRFLTPRFNNCGSQRLSP